MGEDKRRVVILHRYMGFIYILERVTVTAIQRDSAADRHIR